MKPVVDELDAQNIIDLMKYCMHDNGPNLIPAKRKGSSRNTLIKQYVSELIKISSNTGDAIFSETQLRELYRALQIVDFPFPDFLDALNQYGYILKRGNGRFKLCVT